MLDLCGFEKAVRDAERLVKNAEIQGRARINKAIAALEKERASWNNPVVRCKSATLYRDRLLLDDTEILFSEAGAVAAQVSSNGRDVFLSISSSLGQRTIEGQVSEEAEMRRFADAVVNASIAYPKKAAEHDVALASLEEELRNAETFSQQLVQAASSEFLSVDNDTTAIEAAEQALRELKDNPTEEDLAEIAQVEAAREAKEEEERAAAEAKKAEEEAKRAKEEAKKAAVKKFGPIAGGIAAVAVLLAVLFGTHVICFHNWRAATCTAPETCNICGRTREVALGHDYSSPTCTEPSTCSRCGEQHGEPLGHDMTNWSVVKVATCTEAGSEEATCSRCGQTQTREIPMIDHTWSEWSVVKEASCTEEGVEQRTCSVCEKVDQRTVSMTEHVWSEWSVTKQASCVEEGTEERSCTVCGKHEQKTIPTTDHTPGEWEIIKEAGIDEYGEAYSGKRGRTCTVCGAELETERYTLSDEEIEAAFKESCSWYSFDEVSRNPSAYEGRPAVFRGEVVQVLEDGNYVDLRVNVTDEGYWWSDTIYVTYRIPDGAPRILEDDVITIYGRMGGLVSYTSIFGETITLPLLEAVYIED